MEALKSIIPIAIGIGLLLTWSMSKRYTIAIKLILSAALAGLFCVSWFVWPGKPYTNAAVASSGSESSSVVTVQDVPTDSKAFLTISGSSVMNDFLTVELAKSYMASIGCTDISVAQPEKDKKEKYVIGTQNGNKIRFDIKSPGTKEGFIALQEQKADICMASAQGEAMFRETTNENVIGLDGIAVVTNSNNPLQGLCKEDLSAIFKGEITEWSKVKGSTMSGKITIHRMGDKTGIYKMFKELVVGQDIAGTSYEKSQQMVDAISKDANGIGFVSYTFLAKSNNIKSVPVSDARGINPISPNALTISSEKYPLCRRLYLYRPVSGYKPEVNGFINFVKSDEGQKIVESVGFINLNISNDEQASEQISAQDPIAYRNLQKTHTKISSELRFIFGTDNLDSRGYDDIDRLASRLGQPAYRGKTVVLVGYTDNVGSQAGNMSLSEKRAKSLVDNFTNKGIEVSRTIGMGMLHPVSDNNTDVGRSHNRRVEVWIQK